MGEIAISPLFLLIKGVPEILLTVLALHILLNLKVNLKNYFLISILSLIIVYLIRLLPTSWELNTILAIVMWILLFSFVYKLELSKITRIMLSAVVVILMIMFAEILNVLLLKAYFGGSGAEQLLTSNSAITRSLYTMPSTVFFAVFVLLCRLFLSQIRKRRNKKEQNDNRETSAANE